LSSDLDPQASKLDAERTNLNTQFDRPSGETVESSTRTAVLVLGMHRSGTSSVAGALIRLGGAAPRNLLPPQLDNPKGFWESSVLVTLNDDILAAGGSDWQDWRAFDPARIDPPARLALHARARSALADEFGDASLPIVKDPRMCRLMPFWSSVFKEAEWSVRPVLPLRSPLEVALSLNRRNGIPLIRGSIYFDEDYYLDRNPDVGAAGMDPALHYLLHGGRESRDPGPFFSTRQYLVRYPDVAASGLNALAHYETHGRREKRNIPLLKG
jgi:hypothetical protein